MILGNGHPGRGHLGDIWAAREKMPDPSDSFFTDLGREQTGTMLCIARTGPVRGSPSACLPGNSPVVPLAHFSGTVTVGQCLSLF